jgi:branched-chain amino acid transport system permease protein
VRGAAPGTLLITSFALSYGLQNVARLAIAKQGNQEPIVFPRIFSQSLTVGGLTIEKLDLITVAATLLLLLVLTLFFSRASLGLEMRAAAENFLMARVLGVRANFVIVAAFAISGTLAGVVAVLYLARSGGVVPTTGLTPLLIGVVATVLGGMGSLLGAVTGGYALGLITIMLQAYLPANIAPFRDAFVYAAVIGILVLRPEGIFATRRQAVRV